MSIAGIIGAWCSLLTARYGPDLASFSFFIFPIFILLYFLTRNRVRLLSGIVGSLIFYAWGDKQNIYLLIGLVLFAYLFGRSIDHWRTARLSFFFLWGGIFLTLAVLIGYKLRTDVVYPLGLSYVSFQIISYFVDVYKSAENCEKDILKFSFFLLLFPKLPVGPIVNYRQVKSQIADLNPEIQDVAEGLRRFLRGIAKKALIADTLGAVVTPIFNLQSPVINPALAWLVILAYALQLFYDFSGYTDMAIGLGRMLGVRFIENFNFPYLSTSISDFWRRWHISLSAWFREVLFYPLERRRFKWFGQQINILIIFTLTGLWHGFTRNFLAWGLLHGFALVFESTAWGRRLKNLWKPFQHVYALGVILIGWVIFRSPTLDFAYDYLRRLAGDMNGIQQLPFELTSPLPIIEPTFLLAFAAGVLFCFPVEAWLLRTFPNGKIQSSLFFQLLFDVGLILIFLTALASLASATYQPGIYGSF